MKSFHLTQLLAEREQSDRRYLEFLRVSSLSSGIYVLAAGAVDPQKPHTEDEVYFVIRGRAAFACEGQDHQVEPGTILFVEAGVDHRFHSITEELEVLVLFAPCEGSLKKPG